MTRLLYAATAVLGLTGAQAGAVTIDFTISGFAGGGTVTGSFSGSDLNGNGTIEANVAGSSYTEVSAFEASYSGGSIASAFTFTLPETDEFSLIYTLGDADFGRVDGPFGGDGINAVAFLDTGPLGIATGPAITGANCASEPTCSVVGDGLNNFDFSTLFAVVTPASGVPEPAGWAMMVGGFGAIGGALRRARVSRSVRLVTA